MSDTSTPIPNRRLLAMLLALAVVLVGFGSLYMRLALDNPPRWAELAMPLMAALLGLFYWLFPEMSRLSPTWQARFVTFFFGMSALMLLLIIFV